MPKGYRHLTHDLRCHISAYLKSGMTQKEIAKHTGVSQSTISRELKRNAEHRRYDYNIAEQKATSRRCRASALPKKMNLKLTLLLHELLSKKQWSPEQISGFLRKEGIANISHESIYRYIYKDKQAGGKLYKHLRCCGKKYQKRVKKKAGRGLIPNRVGIENRPKIVDEKVRVGDFEIDTIVGKGHKGAIVSVVDRKTKLTRLMHIKRATAKLTSQALIKLLLCMKEHVHTITADNGKEFAMHRSFARKLKAKVYFADPYASYQRGLNENTNRLVRQYFPKGTDFTKLDQMQVCVVESLLNNRPRKSLGFETPQKVFLLETGINMNYALRG